MPKQITRYNARWNVTDSAKIELQCINSGGEWEGPEGQKCGAGLFHHFKAFYALAWPEDYTHRWSDLLLAEFIKGGIIGVAGGSSSGKTHDMAKFALTLYWAFPKQTTVICTTTTRELLELRIWGEIKKYRKMAMERYSWLPGYLIESQQQITTDGKANEGDENDGREFRNGIKGLACVKGDRWVGISGFAGCKNDIMLMLSDEATLMQPGFFDVIGNMRSNSGELRPFTLLASSNPKDPIDAFGQLCMPKQGWDFLEQGEKTHVWETRQSGGRCIRLVGTDSPNFDFPEGQEPFPKLIGRKYVSEIVETYGKDSWQYDTWVLARFPTQVMAKRLFTRQFCEKFNAFAEVNWSEKPLTRLLGLDAAYKGCGGDRCVAIEMAFGEDAEYRKILAIVGRPMLVPIRNDRPELHEDQIAEWVRTYCEGHEIPASHVFYDGTGRSSLTSSFMRVWSTRVNSIEFGGKPSDRPDPQDPRRMCRDVYTKFVSELNFALKLVIESNQFRGMTLDIVEEAENRGWTHAVEKGKIDVEKKEDTKERLKRSPDLLDAAICGVEGARQLGFHIQRLGQGRVNKALNTGLVRQVLKWRDVEKRKELTYV